MYDIKNYEDNGTLTVQIEYIFLKCRNDRLFLCQVDCFILWYMVVYVIIKG